MLSLEGDSTFSSDKVAATADIHLNNYTEDSKYRLASQSTGKPHYVAASSVDQKRGPFLYL